MKFERVLVAVAVCGLLAACQGMYVAGDAGPHSTHASPTSPPPDR